MDIYLPQKEEGKKYPLVVMMHGGGFISGSKENMRAHCRMLADSGFVAVTINYRKGWDKGVGAYGCGGNIESFKDAIYRATQDARAAIRFLINKQMDYSIDTSWLFVGGSSAGAVLALQLAYLDAEDAQQHFNTQVKQFGGLDAATNSFKESFKIKGVCSMWGGIGDSTWINKTNVVPAIFFHGKQDMVVPYDIGRYGTMCENYPLTFGSACLFRQTTKAGKAAVLNTSTTGGHGPKEFWHKITMSNTACFFKKIMQGTAASQSFTDAKQGCR